MYTPHPSPELNELFARKPYQGVPSDEAHFLFVGLDANYEEHIATKPVFRKILEYHTDAVAFWRKYGVHHPFLLPGYAGGGKRYHQSFARLGFTAEHAGQISFTELLHVPTVGRNVLTATDLSTSHLEALNAAILTGMANHIFVSATVARLMRQSRIFPWLPRDAIESSGPLGVLHRHGPRTVYSHLHFSTYGAVAQKKAAQALAIRGLLMDKST